MHTETRSGDRRCTPRAGVPAPRPGLPRAASEPATSVAARPRRCPPPRGVRGLRCTLHATPTQLLRAATVTAVPHAAQLACVCTVAAGQHTRQPHRCRYGAQPGVARERFSPTALPTLAAHAKCEAGSADRNRLPARFIVLQPHYPRATSCHFISLCVQRARVPDAPARRRCDVPSAVPHPRRTPPVTRTAEHTSSGGQLHSLATHVHISAQASRNGGPQAAA